MKKTVCIFLCLLLMLSNSFAKNSKPIIIGIIDTGICTDVIAKENVLKGKNYVREGYDTEDSIGHGTAVAQLILKHQPKALLVPLTYCDDVYRKQRAVSLDTIARMIYDGVDIYKCKIINISAATVSDYKPVKNAIEYAEKKGTVVVAAVGNSGKYKNSYPAAYDTVIGVGALDKEGKIAKFSQKGGVSLTAKGEKLEIVLKDAKKSTVTGSSFACSEVTAAAASLLLKNPDLSPEEIRTLLFKSADDIGKKGFDSESGYGAVNIKRALDMAR